jgi:hypothetical protein
MRFPAFRPEALRPKLSQGLPFTIANILKASRRVSSVDLSLKDQLP